MSGGKQSLLWLMIVCCSSVCQMKAEKNLKTIIRLTDQCAAIGQDVTLVCESHDNNLVMQIKLNFSSEGKCKTYRFKLTVQDSKTEVTLKETDKDITGLYLLDNKNGQISADPTCQNRKDKQNNENCLEIPDPVKACNSTNYDEKICKKNRKKNVIMSFIKDQWMCVTCQTTSAATLQAADVIYNMTVQDDGVIDPPKALGYMNKIESKMDEIMKNNISKAGVFMGDVIGFLHVQDKNTETKNRCYSSDEDNINEVDCQSNTSTNFPWSVKISSEAFNKSRQANNGSAFLGILQFYNMGNENETQNNILNDEVYGITMRASISNLTNKIDMFFTQSNQDGEPSCVSWDGKGKYNWTTFGCATEIINDTIKCSCSHLTFFAVLMIPPSQSNQNITEKDLETLTYITYIGCGISMFFLSIALFMHFLLRKAKSNQATKILMNMFVSLFLLNASFLSNESVANTQDNAACVFIALLLHYSMLASFTWFFIQALHMYLWLIRQNVTITNYMRKITVLGWVFPAPTVVAIASVGEYKTVNIKTSSDKISQMCWITNSYIHYIVNIGYYALVFIFTTGIFITIVTRIVQARRLRAIDGKRKTFRKQLMMVLSLFLLFGLTWSVAFFSYGPMLIPSLHIHCVQLLSGVFPLPVLLPHSQ
ncbi:adhesion G-protein coupled receptor G2-like [Puntigrus tetrazona]|uniref:adhesion G-protein coupled receptor G2-like n=1 Tax=Puntigrus tetrazona TaxID=1606681 RepID=UPI001C8A805B|nr:adhesion G-protein coupled receptor G2-like [Puntigrus tetrazona]